MANRKAKAAKRAAEYETMPTRNPSQERAARKAEMQAIKRELTFKYSRWRWRAFKGVLLAQQAQATRKAAA